VKALGGVLHTNKSYEDTTTDYFLMGYNDDNGLYPTIFPVIILQFKNDDDDDGNIIINGQTHPQIYQSSYPILLFRYLLLQMMTARLFVFLV
jgi:hypothetical protein